MLNAELKIASPGRAICSAFFDTSNPPALIF
jgi:hypothetical protein